MKSIFATSVTILILAAPALATANVDESGLWNEFYQNETIHDDEAFRVLESIINSNPDNVRALKSAAYLKIRQNKTDEALMFSERVLSIEPANEDFSLQKGYLLNKLGKNDEALVVFNSLQNSKNKAIADAACIASQNLSIGSVSKLNKPYFADIYASPSYESRSSVAIIPIKARAGRYYNDDKGQIYGFTTFNRDTKSSGGERPEIIDENALIVGLGINHKIGSTLPVTAYAEVGGSYDLIDRSRSKLQSYIVVGAATYKEWGDNKPTCQSSCVYPMSFHADFYGNVAAYSRNDYNIVADLRYRPGFNIAKNSIGIAKVYWKFKSVHDTDQEFFNNIFETGPGISYTFYKKIPIAIRFESLSAFYLADKSPNGDSGFKNNRVEITYFKSF